MSKQRIFLILILIKLYFEKFHYVNQIYKISHNFKQIDNSFFIIEF